MDKDFDKKFCRLNRMPKRLIVTINLNGFSLIIH